MNESKTTRKARTTMMDMNAMANCSSLSAAAPRAGLQILDHVRCIQAAHDEVSAVLHHFREHFFTICVDERHFTHIDRATSPVAFAVRSFPVRLQLCSPGTYQPALQNPFLLPGCIDDRDSQHFRFSYPSARTA